jgi:hypothetical protein
VLAITFPIPHPPYTIRVINRNKGHQPEGRTMVFAISSGVAQMVVGLGLFVFICAFIPVRGREKKEVDLRIVKFMVYRPTVFAYGMLLGGVGAFVKGGLMLAQGVQMLV